MSSSIFEEYSTPAAFNEDYEDDLNLNPDPNLVVLVDKSGKVSVDERTLHSLLSKYN